MQTKKIIEELKLTHSFQDLIQVYEEAAVSKIQQIRDDVLRSRNFMEELLALFSEVKRSYKTSLFNLGTHKNHKKVKPVEKQLEILLSPMEKMTGEIAHQVVTQFMNATKSSTADLMVLGKTGKDILEQHGYSQKYIYLDLPDPQDSAIKDLLAKIVTYDRVTIYHGHYVNLLTQQPKVSTLTGDLTVTPVQAEPQSVQIEYIFEPSIEELEKIFERQILGTLFNQTLSEADLAKLGSRITAMENASSNVEDRLKALKRRQLLLLKNIESHKQLERMAGIFLIEGRI